MEVALSKWEEKSLRKVMARQEASVSRMRSELEAAEKSGVLMRQAKARRLLTAGEGELTKMGQDLLVPIRYQSLQCCEAYKGVSPEEMRWRMKHSAARDSLHVATVLNLYASLPKEVSVAQSIYSTYVHIW